MISVDLEEEQIRHVISILREKLEDLNTIIRNPDGLSDEVIRDIQSEHTHVNDILRELQFFTVIKES